MTASQGNPNPLRPYYIPPSIGVAADPSGAAPSGSPSVLAGRAKSTAGPASGQSTFSTSARDLLSDLDYGEYLSDPSTSPADTIKRLLDQAVWKYTSVLIAQPFEVAKTVLQCYAAGTLDETPDSIRRRRRGEDFRKRVRDEFGSDESDADEANYFTSAAHSPLTPSRRRREPIDSDDELSSQDSRKPETPKQGHIILARPSSLLEAISQLWTREGAWGIWKGANTTFIYSVLLKSMESWARSLLAALLNLPDPSLMAGVVDIADSPFPMASLGVAVAAAGIAGVFLAPLDIVRTQLILTPTSQQPRALLPGLKALPSSTCPLSILPVTLVHSTLPTLISTSTPLVLRSYFNVDPVLTPNTYSAMTFVSACAELFVRLPLETVLRRGQIHTVRTARLAAIPSTPASRDPSKQSSSSSASKFETVVPLGAYNGIFGTMWAIVRDEGERLEHPPAPTPTPSSTNSPSSSTPSLSRRQATRSIRPIRRKGQGLEGLWRGWRVGMWGLVGIWGAAAIGSAGKGGEF